ncbi:phage tail tape measure protein [Chromohalobacter israelensis]|uniref:phage tail tape measure protein n=1 Tax=Chromohalobacter israelensis TaxID=141390 RepID=UPI001CC7582E|nr:phage tail tape measure protein [Chromohalobacter salexigens]MBZ5876001.1 hypothetical protein [Chromohalobacter salexigens]
MARDLKLQVVLDAVDRVTRPLKKITQGSGKTAEALKASREQLKTLERAQQDLRGFRQLKEQSKESAATLDAQQRQVRELTQQIENAEGPTRQLTRQRAAAIRQARKLKDRYQGEQRQLEELRRGMTRVDGVTGSYSDQQRELSRRIGEANNQVDAQKRKLGQLAEAQKRAQRASDQFHRGVGRANAIRGAGMTGLATGGVGMAAMTTQAFGNEMAGARLAAQFGEGTRAAEYREITTNIYSGGRGNGMQDVERAVGAVGAAFGSLEEQSSEKISSITTQALTLQEVFGIDIAQSIQTAKNMVKNELAPNATAAFDLIAKSFQEVPAAMRDELPDILEEYGTNFRALGFSGQEAMSLLVAAADKGRFALDKTGDAVKEFTIRGSDMSKASVEAYDVIGLNAHDMSNAIASGGDQARAAMQTTAKAILDIEDPARRANTAIALFGTPLEDLSVDQIPQFLKALGGTKDRLGEVTGATREMADTLDDNAWKALKDVMRALAGPFMTALEGVRDDIIDVSKAITGWIKENPELAGTLAKIAIMLTTLIAACGAFTIMMSSLLGPIVTVRLGLAMLGVKTTGLGGRIYALTSKILPALGKGILMIGRTLAVAGRLLLTNPIGLAITALAGAAYLIYKNWGAISGWFAQRWADIKAAFNDGIGAVGRLLLNWSPLGLLYRGITAALSALGVEVPAKFQNLGSAIVDGLIGGIGAKMGQLKDKVVGIADSVGGWFKDKLGINSPSRVFAQFGGYTIDGLNQGLDAQRNEPARRIAQIAKSVTRAGAGMALGAATLPATAAMPIANDVPIDTRAPLQSPGGGSVSITMGDINIHPSPGMDEQALARYVRAEVERALADATRDAEARRRSAFHDID